MSKYVSPIMEMELIDVEDILLMSNDNLADNETNRKPINSDSNIDIDAQSVNYDDIMSYFN